MRSLIPVMFLTLAACGTSGPTPSASPTASAPSTPVTLAATRSYACVDHTKASIGWMSDGMSADVKMGDARPVHVEAALPGAPMNGAGMLLRGTKDADSVNVLPAGAAQSVTCNVAPAVDPSVSPSTAPSSSAKHIHHR